jgi:hypothetical protein
MPVVNRATVVTILQTCCRMICCHATQVVAARHNVISKGNSDHLSNSRRGRQCCSSHITSMQTRPVPAAAVRSCKKTACHLIRSCSSRALWMHFAKTAQQQQHWPQGPLWPQLQGHRGPCNCVGCCWEACHPKAELFRHRVASCKNAANTAVAEVGFSEEVPWANARVV